MNLDPGVTLSTLAYGSSAGFGLGTAFLVFRWGANFVAGRFDKRQEHLDHSTDSLIVNLRAEVDRLYNRMTQYEEQLEECRKEHARTQEELSKLRGLIDARGEMRDRAQTMIAVERLKDKGMIPRDPG